MNRREASSSTKAYYGLDVQNNTKLAHLREMTIEDQLTYALKRNDIYFADGADYEGLAGLAEFKELSWIHDFEDASFYQPSSDFLASEMRDLKRVWLTVHGGYKETKDYLKTSLIKEEGIDVEFLLLLGVRPLLLRLLRTVLSSMHIVSPEHFPPEAACTALYRTAPKIPKTIQILNKY